MKETLTQTNNLEQISVIFFTYVPVYKIYTKKTPGSIFKAFHFLCNLRMGPCQAYQASFMQHSSQGSLTKGNTQYGCSPCTD